MKSKIMNTLRLSVMLMLCLHLRMKLLTRDCGFGKAVQTTDSEDEQEVKDIAANILSHPWKGWLNC